MSQVSISGFNVAIKTNAPAFNIKNGNNVRSNLCTVPRSQMTMTRAAMNQVSGNNFLGNSKANQGVKIQDGKQQVQKSSHSYIQGQNRQSGQDSRYQDLTAQNAVNFQAQQVKNGPVFFDHPMKNIQNILSSQRFSQNQQKHSLNNDVQFSIMNQNPVNYMGQYMDKVFGQGTQQKTMLNKMIGRAFVTVALPVALSLGHPSLAVAQTAEKFANDPRIQLAPQQVTDNMNTQAPKKFEGTFKAFPTSSLILGSTTPAFLDSTIDQLNKWDNNGEVDLARDTGLRYLGYANETGESFKFIAPQFLTPSYALAYGYCLADGLYKGLHYFYDNGQVMSSGVFKAFGDALIFQCFASVLIPGNIIAFIVETSDEKFKELEATKDNEAVNKWGPTVLGLGSIPFIVHPIDVSVDWVMEHSIRLLYGFF